MDIFLGGEGEGGGGVFGGGYVELTKVIYLLGFIFVLLLFR